MAAVDWSSLPSDLVIRVADIFLSTSDVDCYVSLRAACHNWRVSTDAPRGLDPRFHPRRWVLLESVNSGDNLGRSLFLNIDTGRFLWKDLPVLRKYGIVTSATDGLLLLKWFERRDTFCLLNPFTGHIVRFHVSPKYCFAVHRSVVVSACSSPMLYTLWNCQPVACTDPISCKTTMIPYDSKSNFTSMASFQGRVYAVDRMGSVIVLEGHSIQRHERLEMATVVTGGNCAVKHEPFLVDNGGELLLVRLLASESGLQVLRVDIENKALQMTNCIGSRAIFLALGRCLSVDAGNLPTVEANCIYYYSRERIHIHHLEDGRLEILNNELPMPEEKFYEYGQHRRPQGPLHLVAYIQSKCNLFRDPELFRNW